MTVFFFFNTVQHLIKHDLCSSNNIKGERGTRLEYLKVFKGKGLIKHLNLSLKIMFMKSNVINGF